jgi:pimeloyl-ACP methyl ester carboxylesterase
LEFSRQVAPPLLERNQDIVLHHMHDRLQDAPKAAQMAYFRLQWHQLPAAYAAFVEDHLALAGTVVVVNDASTWPVSPTVDPQYRTPLKQFVVFAKGNPHERFRTVRQVPDWSRAGPVRIIRCFRSAIALPLEDVLPQVSAEITIIHTEYDPLTSHAYAASLAADNGAQLVLMPGASHSWPKDDPPGFLQFMDGLVRAVHDGMAT